MHEETESLILKFHKKFRIIIIIICGIWAEWEDRQEDYQYPAYPVLIWDECTVAKDIG